MALVMPEAPAQIPPPIRVRDAGRATAPAAPAARAISALSVDVDDWGVAVLGPTAPLTERVVANTRRVLSLLAEFGVQGTFFVLGRVAEAYPHLLREIDAAGHEVACHGWGHELITRQTPSEFRRDVSRALATLATITGRRPIGYRAPAFSIVRATRWAGAILAELGVRYSSSVFPFAGRRYGDARVPAEIHRWPEAPLVEFPPSVVQFAGRRWPIAGGGYFRLLPGWLARAGLRRATRGGRPAMVYLHPYEFDTAEIGALRRAGWPIPRRVGLMQSLFRGQVEARWRALLGRMRFGPARDVLADWL
ncbi:MAG: DUF3473 domain-containing protein [Phycisphaerae bacterium]